MIAAAVAAPTSPMPRLELKASTSQPNRVAINVWIELTRITLNGNSRAPAANAASTHGRRNRPRATTTAATSP